MKTRDSRDLTSGVALFALGAAVVAYSLAEYPVGTLTRMGPGMFPVALGAILVGLGLVIGVPALFRPGDFPDVHLRQMFVIIGAIFGFGFALPYIGVIPSVILLTAALVLADNQLGVVATLALSIGMAVVTYLLFDTLLAVPFQAYRWPF